MLGRWNFFKWNVKSRKAQVKVQHIPIEKLPVRLQLCNVPRDCSTANRPKRNHNFAIFLLSANHLIAKFVQKVFQPAFSPTQSCAIDCFTYLKATSDNRKMHGKVVEWDFFFRANGNCCDVIDVTNYHSNMVVCSSSWFPKHSAHMQQAYRLSPLNSKCSNIVSSRRCNPRW